MNRTTTWTLMAAVGLAMLIHGNAQAGERAGNGGTKGVATTKGVAKTTETVTKTLSSTINSATTTKPYTQFRDCSAGSTTVQFGGDADRTDVTDGRRVTIMDAPRQPDFATKRCDSPTVVQLGSTVDRSDRADFTADRTDGRRLTVVDVPHRRPFAPEHYGVHFFEAEETPCETTVLYTTPAAPAVKTIVADNGTLLSTSSTSRKTVSDTPERTNTTSTTATGTTIIIGR